MRDHAAVRDDHDRWSGCAATIRWNAPQTRASNSSSGSAPGMTSQRSWRKISMNSGSFATARSRKRPPSTRRGTPRGGRLLDGRDSEPLCERRRGLVRAAQCRHVDRVDLLAGGGRRAARPAAHRQDELGITVTVVGARTAGPAPRPPTRRGERRGRSSRRADAMKRCWRMPSSGSNRSGYRMSPSCSLIRRGYGAGP